jgi:hypothetical protein
MSRNRKNQSAAIRFAPALRTVVLCAFIGGSAVGYVWQKNQIASLGRQLKERETRLDRLDEANAKLSKQLVTLRSPTQIERRLKELNLPLGQPGQLQILRLPETLPGEATPEAELLMAERHRAGAAQK